MPPAEMPSTNYAVRVRMSYETLATTCADWSLKSEKMLCYQHDDKKENIHCHFLLVGVYDSTDTLKRLLKTHGLLPKASDWSFKSKFKLKDGTVVDITDETIPQYITYMSKGKYEPSYNKGYDTEFLDLCKSKWVTYTRDPVYLQDYYEFIDYVNRREKVFHLIRESSPLCVATVHVYSCEWVKQKYKGFIPHVARKQIKDLKDNYCIDNHLMAWTGFALPFERTSKV